MSKNIVFEGWLTKSPPNRRIWRTRWRRRWFALRQSGELPGQYFLDYYADRNCRRLKGTIDLDLCEQVDAGLHMERHGQAPLKPKIRGSVFTIQTQRRTYHLEADCEAEMERWVDAICRVCGLRATEEPATNTTARHNIHVNVSTLVNVPTPAHQDTTIYTYQNNLSVMSAMSNKNYEAVDGTGPYIPISECITGVRAPDDQSHFSFEPTTIASHARQQGQQYTSQPHIRINSELSENDSNCSDEDDHSLHASHQNLPDWAVTKTFTKLSVAPSQNGSEDGPPVPPRPPKTFAGRSREPPLKDPFQGPKIQEPVEVYDNAQHAQRLRVPRRMSQGAPSSPRQLLIPVVRCPEEEEEFSPGHASMQYCNLPSLPPAVDRNLKPRHSSHSIGHFNSIMTQAVVNVHVQTVTVHQIICACDSNHCQGCHTPSQSLPPITTPTVSVASLYITCEPSGSPPSRSRSSPTRLGPPQSTTSLLAQRPLPQIPLLERPLPPVPTQPPLYLELIGEQEPEHIYEIPIYKEITSPNIYDYVIICAFGNISATANIPPVYANSPATANIPPVYATANIPPVYATANIPPVYATANIPPVYATANIPPVYATANIPPVYANSPAYANVPTYANGPAYANVPTYANSPAYANVPTYENIFTCANLAAFTGSQISAAVPLENETSQQNASAQVQAESGPPAAQALVPGLKLGQCEDKPDVLQYLDLDLHTSKPPQVKGPEPSKPNKKVEIAHGKSMSAVDTDAYKTVDFLKTEAFNITRQDAEASRSIQY